MLYSQSTPALPTSAAIAMPHPLVAPDTRRFLKTSHWIAPSMPAYSPEPKNSTPATKRVGAVNSTSRVDKRKRRRPIRSLPAPSDTPRASLSAGEPTPRTSCSVKMSYLDDYQRNPMAYSRALMGTCRPLDSIASYPNSASIFSASPKPPFYLRRTQSSTPRSSSRSLSTSLVSSPSPFSEAPEQQPHELQQQRRKSTMTSIVRRLFPSLDDDSLAALAATAAAQPPPSPQPKKRKSQMVSNPPGSEMAGEFHSAEKTKVADPGSNGDNTEDNGAEMQTPQTINNGNDAMYVGDKLGREIFQLRPQANSCPIKWTK
ncbi:hypothetical protein GGI23_007255, partial [Coemansia sp. RSA 2559]